MRNYKIEKSTIISNNMAQPIDDDLNHRYDLCRSIAVECIQEEELLELLRVKPNPICYDGFEPSGRMHIAQGIMKALNVNKLTSAGCTFIFWVADWFALMNNKLGGDLAKIQIVGEYMIEIWRACGMDMSRVEFKWSSTEINNNANDYWMRVIDIATKFNIARITRCSQIMGREESADLSVAQLMYPCMQCADIFHLKADICQLGMDQRKVNMLAREYCNTIKRKYKPIILSHAMLPGLQGQEKMSKSDPASAIFMEDTELEVQTKIRKCFCPLGIIENNPIMAYIEMIILPKLGVLRVQYGDDHTDYTDMETLQSDYVDGVLHPGDLKPAVARAINTILQPIRDWFTNNERAAELQRIVRGYKIVK